MAWRTRISALAAIFASLLAISASAQTLYVATGATGATGNLFTVNTATAATTVVGPILVGALPIAITGLAVQPSTGTLFGITSNGSPNIARHLVTINTATGAATDIGVLGISGADIAFNAAGTLYMSSGNATSLFTVNTATGATTLVGATGTGDSGAGLAINGGGTAFFAGNGAAGTLDTLNLATGAATIGPAMTGAPIAGGQIDAMKFSGGGVLFAVNITNGGGAADLVTINTATGAVTNIGALPANIDGLAFAASAAGGLPSSGIPTLSQWAMIMMGLLLLATGWWMNRRLR